MGLCIAVYRWSLGDCTNGGASAAVKDICVINMSGPSEPNERAPAFMLTKGPSGDPVLKPVQGKTGIGPMFGGNFAHSSDARFGEAIEAMTGRRFWGALPIFDRFESPEENRLYGA